MWVYWGLGVSGLGYGLYNWFEQRGIKRNADDNFKKINYSEEERKEQDAQLRQNVEELRGQISSLESESEVLNNISKKVDDLENISKKIDDQGKKVEEMSKNVEYLGSRELKLREDFFELGKESDENHKTLVKEQIDEALKKHSEEANEKKQEAIQDSVENGLKWLETEGGIVQKSQWLNEKIAKDELSENDLKDLNEQLLKNHLHPLSIHKLHQFLHSCRKQLLSAIDNKIITSIKEDKAAQPAAQLTAQPASQPAKVNYIIPLIFLVGAFSSIIGILGFRWVDGRSNNTHNNGDNEQESGNWFSALNGLFGNNNTNKTKPKDKKKSNKNKSQYEGGLQAPQHKDKKNYSLNDEMDNVDELFAANLKANMKTKNDKNSTNDKRQKTSYGDDLQDFLDKNNIKHKGK